MQKLLNTAEIPSTSRFEPEALHRIGAVSRLSGVPVTTLRVWESRYAAFAPAKSSGRHRLYTDADVMKARLLRQLAGSGHGIGGMAGLPLPRLQQMLAASPEARPAARTAPRIAAIVVGDAIAARVTVTDWQQRHFGGAFWVQRAFVDLEQAAAAGPQPAADGSMALLLVRLNALHPSSYEQLCAAIERLGVERVVVLYNFGPEALVEAMRSAGMLVRREPVPSAELADLVRSVVMVDAAESLSTLRAGALIPRRRFSDATLARVAASPSSVVCECPRHIADLIGQLSSFEEYSEQCLNDTAEDARLHAYLRSVAGSARALFEHALELAARHGGLALDDAGAAPEGPVAAVQQNPPAPRSAGAQ